MMKYSFWFLACFCLLTRVYSQDADDLSRSLEDFEDLRLLDELLNATEEFPAEEFPAEEFPAEEFPAEGIPAEEMPAEGIPAEEMPTEGIPVDSSTNTSIPSPTSNSSDAGGNLSFPVPADNIISLTSAPVPAPSENSIPHIENVTSSASSLAPEEASRPVVPEEESRPVPTGALRTNSPTKAPSAQPTYDPMDFEEELEDENFEDEFVDKTEAPYVPPSGNDPYAEMPDETEWGGGDWPQETPEEMMHDKNVGMLVASIVLVSLLCLFLFSVGVAQQMIDNPDGCCASICRCCVNCYCCVFRIVCFPLALCCPRRQHEQLATDYSHDLELS